GGRPADVEGLVEAVGGGVGRAVPAHVEVSVPVHGDVAEVDQHVLHGPAVAPLRIFGQHVLGVLPAAGGAAPDVPQLPVRAVLLAVCLPPPRRASHLAGEGDMAVAPGVDGQSGP